MKDKPPWFPSGGMPLSGGSGCTCDCALDCAWSEQEPVNCKCNAHTDCARQSSAQNVDKTVSAEQQFLLDWIEYEKNDAHEDIKLPITLIFHAASPRLAWIETCFDPIG
jgi:hypothetical protein